MYPHRIRLRGPWEATFTSNGPKLSQRITLPGTWDQLQSATGPVTLTRSFGRPRVLDADESIWLAWSDVAMPADIVLNEMLIHSNDAFTQGGVKRLAQTLNERNTLAVRCPRSGSASQDIGEFALEIRGAVYLEDLRHESEDGGPVITGRVSGVPRANLDLYVLVDGRTVSHQVVRSEPTGVAFRVPCTNVADELKNPGFPPIRVELVEGATCWWRADFSRESDVPVPPA